MARKQQLMCEVAFDKHAFLRDACTWMHLLYDALAEEIVEVDQGDNGTCAEFTVEVTIRVA